MKKSNFFFLTHSLLWKNHLWLFLFNLFLWILNALIQSLSIWITVNFFNEIIQHSGKEEVFRALKWVYIYLGVNLINFIIVPLMERYIIKLEYAVFTDMRYQIMKKTLKLHPKYLVDQNKDEFINKLENDAKKLTEGIMSWQNAVNGIVNILGVIIIFWSFGSPIVIAILAAVVFLKIFFNIFVAQYNTKIQLKKLDLEDTRIQKVSRWIDSVHNFIFANKIMMLFNYFKKDTSKLYLNHFKIHSSESLGELFSKLIDFALLASFFIAGFALYKSNLIEFAVLLTIILYFSEILNQFTFIISLIKKFKELSRLKNKLTIYFSSKLQSKLLAKETFSKLYTNNLTISYLDNKPIFKNFSFEILAKEKVLMVGESGSGKSTLTKALLNLINYQGEIYFNSTKIETDTDLSLNIGYCEVNSELLPFEKIEQVIAGNEAFDLDRISDLCKLLSIDLALYQNKSFDINSLSVGEQQKLKLANSFYQDKDIYILDEVISNLDESSRETIANNILNYDKTIIVISHHISDSEIKDRFTKIIDLNQLKLKDSN
ncbi:ABC transporter ATP-binding protein [Mycoplasma buteonis]|uniref:ABC transporter ATP-binding protein n=1 Tax=Mycoplasma buteonis TaxID=171280 RepID=UPI000564B651|nr:ABC transporter ATP-binding protein [Mycoplasma buteonis]